MQRLRIGIVGGSIAGCCAAARLLRDGHDVQVFERVQRGLTGEGSGMGLLPATLAALVEHGLLDEALPRLRMSAQLFVGACADEPRYGREALRWPLESWSVNLADVFRALRSRLEDSVYHAGVSVDAFASEPTGAEVSFSDGTRRSFDLLIFADGHASLARSALYPEHVPSYRGYLLWRGVAPVADMDVSRLRGNLTRISLGGRAGHAGFYLIPAGDGDSDPARASLNFGYYLPVASDELETWLLDRELTPHRSSIPKGEIASVVEQRLRALADERLPDYYARLVAHTSDISLHAMFAARLPHYCVQRVCLIGDASTLAPPFTASGVMKAAHQTIELARALRAHRELDAALAAWDARQVRFGDGLYALAEQMEEQLIWRTPDLATLDAEAARGWWQATLALRS
jgi:2-polyprenyl-6-methoxyphenol hydroxylase-like FAD-dependent oxidoreductase